MIALEICNAHEKMKYANRDLNSNVNYSSSSRLSKDEAQSIRLRFPTKIPIIVQRAQYEIELPMLDKRKFLVPLEITMSQFVSIIRNRIRIGPSKALFLLINNRTMVALSRTIAEIYAEHRDSDGFLYITYASQEVFGNDKI